MLQQWALVLLSAHWRGERAILARKKGWELRGLQTIATFMPLTLRCAQ